MYKALDICCGAGGATQAMKDDPKWDVTTIDVDEKFDPDICADILDIEPEDLDDDYNVIIAAPPCDRFTVASIGRYWKDGYIPKTKDTVNRVKIVYHILYLINKLDPDYWFLENPRGMLRTIIGKPHGVITQCQYGRDQMKPTDLWGEHPPSFVYRRCSKGDDCHEKAPRGTSDQGIENNSLCSEERAKFPYGLSEAIKQSVENPSRTNLKDFIVEKTGMYELPPLNTGDWVEHEAEWELPQIGRIDGKSRINNAGKKEYLVEWYDQDREEFTATTWELDCLLTYIGNEPSK